MKDIKVDVSIKGIRPLLMNPFLLDEPKTKKGHVYTPQEEAEKRLIRKTDGTLYQPATHIEGSIVKSGSSFKFEGKKTYKDILKAGVFVDPLEIPHKIIDWKIDCQVVTVMKSHIPRYRPIFDNWELDFEIKIIDDRIQPLVLKEILEAAGKYVGIGDYRPRYGLFEVIQWTVKK